ncbi:MAG: histidine kinase dimerization/phospho-acceptor domain-containing protein [Erythrobacter sp.]
MFFDDRLATVLRQQGFNQIGQRTQFRQLLDILGNRKFATNDGADRSLIAAAWLRMDALGRTLPASERAAMIREPSWRFRSADLAAHLADFEPEVASAALNRAQLSAEDWNALIPRLPVRARGFLRLRKDLPVDVETLLDRLGVSDRGLPPPPAGADEAFIETLINSEPAEAPEASEARFGPEPEQAPEPDPVPFPSKLMPSARSDEIERGRSEISALVERIAQFKRTRDPEDIESVIDSERSPRLPLGEFETPSSRRATGFGFSADAAGRIEWADPEVATMVVGTKLVAPPVLGEAGKRTALQRAMTQRQPVTRAKASLRGAAAIAGDWIVDAQPRFTQDGHFTGYVGRFRRPAQSDPDAPGPAEREADRIRQILHELRTPVTAVQGYAEVIQQQLFGPAPHEYRALSAAIAADAARILAGFEEMDRLARLETGIIAMEPGDTDIATLAQRTVRQLAHVLSPRMAGLEIDIRADIPVRVNLDPEEAELLLWRLLATLGGGCGAGETIEAVLEASGDAAILTVELPRQLLEEDDIFTAEAKPIGTAINAGVFGAGFSLRLARAEARMAGGGLEHEQDTIILRMPLLQSEDRIGDARDPEDAGNGSNLTSGRRGNSSGEIGAADASA